MSKTTDGQTVLAQGRIVWVNKDLFKGQVKTDFNTKAPLTDAQGEPVIEYGFGLAVPKASLSKTGQGEPGEIWKAIHEEAYKLYPSQQLPPDFAMKFKDGDGVDHNGVPFSQREGYAGNVVFTLTTRIPIKFFKWENGQNVMINEGIKCGDYVNVQVQVKAHGAVGRGKAGMYLNPMAVQFLGYGTEIVNAPSGDQIFGAPPAMPEGASDTPIAPQGGQMLVSNGQQAPAPQPAPQPQGMPQPAPAPQQAPQPAPAPQPQQAPTPHYGVLPQTQQPGSTGSQMPQAPAPQQATTPQAPVPQGTPQPQGMPPVPGSN